MMSPPTSPALSAGEPGGSTFPNVTPSSVTSKPSTPKYERSTIARAIVGMLVRAFFSSALRAPPPAEKTAIAMNTQVIPPRRRFLLPDMLLVPGRIIGEVKPGLKGSLARAFGELGSKTVSVYSAGPSRSEEHTSELQSRLH